LLQRDANRLIFIKLWHNYWRGPVPWTGTRQIAHEIAAQRP
jgi:hypothetical protein